MCRNIRKGYFVVKNPLIICESWRWDENTDELIDITADPHKKYPASSYDAKVQVYESRVREWFLDIASNYVNSGENPSDYLALSIALSYIEGVEQYRRGISTPQRKSGEWFKNSAKRIFPTSSESAINRLWKECRCGLFHSGFTDGRIYLSHGYDQPIAIVGADLQVNPKFFIEAVCNDFTNYVDSLHSKKDAGLMDNFVKLWDHRWENS